MASLSEIRQKYPQYQDMPDAVLVDHIHKKFYSDIPRAEFNKRVGFDGEPQNQWPPNGGPLNLTVVRPGNWPIQGPPPGGRGGDPPPPERDPGFGFDPSSAFDPGGLKPVEQSTGARIANDITADQQAASQGTSPVVRDFGGGFVRGEPLGELGEFDFGQAYYDKTGKLTAINPKTDVILRDPQSGKQLVFARSPGTDESRALSTFRIMAPGIATAPPVGKVGNVAKAVPKIAAPTRPRPQKIVEAFDKSGIDVSVPVVTENRGVGGMSKWLGETVAGGPITRGTKRQMAQASRRVDDIAGGLSDVGDRATAGERLQSGARRFVDETVPSIQSRLYDDARALIDPAAKTATPNALRAVDEVDASIGNAAVRRFAGDANYRALADTIKEANRLGGLSFDDLRELRTQVRRLKPSQDTKVGLNKAAIDRVYNALTKDMHAMARAEGGEDALKLIQRADGFTAGAAEHKTSIKKVLDAPSGERVYDEVMRLAGEGAGSDWRRLLEIRRATDIDGWQDISATVIRNLGKMKPGAVTSADDAGFSISSFVTNWEKLSKPGKDILFGAKTETRAALEDLATAVGELKRVERLANPSGTGRFNTGLATVAAFSQAPITTSIVLVGGNVAARVLMNPKYARWIARSAQLQLQNVKHPSRGAAKMWQQHVARIPAIAGRDKEIGSLLRQIAGVGQAEPGREPESPTK